MPLSYLVQYVCDERRTRRCRQWLVVRVYDLAGIDRVHADARAEGWLLGARRAGSGVATHLVCSVCAAGETTAEKESA